MLKKWAARCVLVVGAIGIPMLVGSAVWGQEDEAPPPPPKIKLDEAGIDSVLGQVESYLKAEGVQDIRALVVGDGENRLFVFDVQAPASPLEYEVDESHVVVPVDLGERRGAVTNQFEEYVFIYSYNPVVAGGCGDNHGGKRNCN